MLTPSRVTLKKLNGNHDTAAVPRPPGQEAAVGWGTRSAPAHPHARPYVSTRARILLLSPGPAKACRSAPHRSAPEMAGCALGESGELPQTPPGSRSRDVRHTSDLTAE